MTTDLNRWSATTVMGWTIEEGRYGAPMYSGGYLVDGMGVDSDVDWWSPSTDRNQLAMVLEKVKLNSPQKAKIINAIVSDHLHEYYERCGARELWRLLTAPPAVVLQALYDAMEGQAGE